MDKRNSRDCDSTSTMSEKDWQDKNLFSTILMLIHSFKTGYYILYYLLDVHKFKSIDFFKLFFKFANEKETPFIFENLIKTTNDWTKYIKRSR